MTEDEKIELLENLIQGSEDVEKTTQNISQDASLRKDYAKQQFIHALLRSQIELQNPCSTEKRVQQVISKIDKVISSTPAPTDKPLIRLRKRTILPYATTAAALLLVVLTTVLLTPTAPLEAEALIETMAKKSFENLDRLYSVEIILMQAQGSQRKLNGWLHVRGADKSVMELDAPRGKVVRIINGPEMWTIPARGPIVSHKHWDYLQEIDSEAANSPQLSMERLIARRGEFEMRIYKNPTDSPDLVLIHCAPPCNRQNPRFKEAKYWVDKNTKLLVRAEIVLSGGKYFSGNRKIKIEFAKEQKQDESFYNYVTHNKDKRPVLTYEMYKAWLEKRHNEFLPK